MAKIPRNKAGAFQLGSTKTAKANPAYSKERKVNKNGNSGLNMGKGTNGTAAFAARTESNNNPPKINAGVAAGK